MNQSKVYTKIITMDTIKTKILIVEDDTDLLDSLTEQFTQDGFEVLKATNGEEGLNSSLSNHPNIILLDVLMPKMDGMTVMRKLRTDLWGKTVPIIILTNLNPDNEVLKEILENKPAYYLIKANSSMVDIVQKVKDVLKPEVE